MEWRQYDDGIRRSGEGGWPGAFVAAYRRIVQLMRQEGAYNVSFVWHMNWSDGPSDSWNRLENYYPGDDMVDWIGVSVYGPQRPTQNWNAGSFRAQMDGFYGRIQALASDRPMIVSEVGAAANNPAISAADYARAAFSDVLRRPVG